jgi:hypothetical protein
LRFGAMLPKCLAFFAKSWVRRPRWQFSLRQSTSDRVLGRGMAFLACTTRGDGCFGSLFLSAVDPMRPS